MFLKASHPNFHLKLTMILAISSTIPCSQMIKPALLLLVKCPKICSMKNHQIQNPPNPLNPQNQIFLKMILSLLHPNLKLLIQTKDKQKICLVEIFSANLLQVHLQLANQQLKAAKKVYSMMNFCLGLENQQKNKLLKTKITCLEMNLQ